MYRPQNTAAPRAHNTPCGSRFDTPWPSGNNTASPAAASASHTKSNARREQKIATASGPLNSMATATPKGIVRSER